MRSLSAITCILLLAFAALSSGAEVKEPSTSSSISGLIPDNNEYHRLCDKGKPAALDNAKPRACFTTKLHVAKNLHDPQPAELHGFIDSSGKRFLLYPDAKVKLRNLEIHVLHAKRDKHEKDKDASCVRVIVRRLPEREIQVRETWCPGQFQPIII